MNMSYCRFRNTEAELKICAQHLLEPLEKTEHEARKRILELCKEIVASEFDMPDEPRRE